MGNQAANDAAISTCRHLYPSEAAVLQSRAQDVERDMRQLRRLYQMHLELYQARIRQEQLDNQQDNHGLEARRPDDQLELLINWEVGLPRQQLPIRIDWTAHTVLGPTLSNMFVRWGRSLLWPSDADEHHDDPGITFMELAVNFAICVGAYLPVKRPKIDGLLYLIMPQSSTHAAALEVKLNEMGIMMAYLMHQANQLCDPPVFPQIQHAGCKSLYRLGAKQQSKGLVKRPQLPEQERTMRLLASCVRQHGEAVPQHGVEIEVSLDLAKIQSEIRESWPARQEKVKRLIQRAKKLR
eukprot:Skav230949  [mRNA]  locus=scaffold3010:63972:64859:- [translate_table: standard]